MEVGSHALLLERYRSAVQALDEQSASPHSREEALTQAANDLRRLPVAPAVATNAAILSALLSDSADVVVRHSLAGGARPASLICLNGLVNTTDLGTMVVRPLTECSLPPALSPAELSGWVGQAVLSAWRVAPAQTIGELLHAILDGATALVLEGAGAGLAVYLPESEGRAVEEPAAEPTIRGPREGFTEHLSTNTALLRRRLRSPHLRVESMRIGRSSCTIVVMVYLRDIADPAVVAEVRRRLADVEIDSLEDSSYLEELIEDNPYSLFPTIMNTERPDAVAASLAEGRVAILADNSPSALIVPVSLWSFLQASEDHYQRYPIATFLRLLRLGLAAMSLLGPALWIAVLSYHQEMLPSALLLTVAATREGIPFPAIVEALLMEIFFEALREAGVRLPRPIGQAVSIVGALVIGQAAVQAGIVSAPKVIVVAATGIASFTIPRFNLGIALRLLRFVMMILAGTLGLFGIMMGLIMLLYHLCALRSFGVPYLSPVAPLSLNGLKDSLVRGPRWLLDQQPAFLGALRRRRMAPGQRPAPPSGTSGGRVR